MKLRFLPLALLLSTSLLACGVFSGGGTSSKTCELVEIGGQLAVAAPMSPGSGDTVFCLGRTPRNDEETGEAQCVAFLGTKSVGGACSCPADQGLQDVRGSHKNAAIAFGERIMDTSGMDGCVCEIKQITADDGDRYFACAGDATSPVVDASGDPVNGFCYISPRGPAIESVASAAPELLKSCSSTQIWGLRFVGRPSTQGANDLRVEVTCTSDPCTLGE